MTPPTEGLMSTGPKKLWQHAQNLYKLKPDTIPAWRRGSEQCSPLTKKLFGIARRGKVGFLQWSNTGCINHTQGRQHLRNRWTTQNTLYVFVFFACLFYFGIFCLSFDFLLSSSERERLWSWVGGEVGKI